MNIKIKVKEGIKNEDNKRRKTAYQDDTQVNEVHVERHFAEEEKLIICLTECGELFG